MRAEMRCLRQVHSEFIQFESSCHFARMLRTPTLFDLPGEEWIGAKEGAIMLERTTSKASNDKQEDLDYDPVCSGKIYPRPEA